MFSWPTLPLFFSIYLGVVVNAAPIAILGRSASTAPVSNASITSDFVRPAQFSRLAYCSNAAVEALDCGGPCDDLGAGTVKTLLTGGNGEDLPRFFIAQDDNLQSIVVAHQGTNSSSPLSVINDLKADLRSLNTTLFPQAGDDVQAHDGFADAQEQTADAILAAVQDGLSSSGYSKVLVTGHSLGAAISSLDALMLSMRLDQSVQITTTTFGTPRGGNQAFADLIDSRIGSTYSFVTHANDPVPRVPPKALDYVHPSGEVHIISSSQTIACVGQENDECSDGNSLLDLSVDDHLGPYFDNIFMSASACPA
ncbi:alpha/beta-hydrolase [Peniophora sp. CONT]|nr:alpha/beta-hydrolase [Peniophora sp. CONT]